MKFNQFRYNEKIKLVMTSLLLLIANLFGFTQPNDRSTWSKEQLIYHEVFLKFCRYVDNRDTDKLSVDSLFKNYIYFDYVLNDTSLSRKERRLKIFPSVLQPLHHFIDSVGANNLDSRPISFYERDVDFFKPFTLELKQTIPNVLVYYKKGRKNDPAGTILFDPITHKMVAWEIISQGGYYYYMTFNLL
jgi:hypothetical protein